MNLGAQVAQLAQTAESFAGGGDARVVRLMLSDPVRLVPGSAYMLAALIRGTDGYCCEDCMGLVVAGGVRVKFCEWESANGTNECRGQFPELYIRPL
jgi:PHR domain